MDKIMQRWRQLNEQMKAYEDKADDEVAFWEDPDYNAMFEERADIVRVMSQGIYEVKKQAIKTAYSKQLYGVKTKPILTGTMWVTINPADGQERQFIDRVHRFMRRSCMKGQYCFEQRGEVVGDYHGLHTHALVEYYPNLKRDLIAQFSPFCDANHIKIMRCTEDDIERRVNYMTGTKASPEKQTKVLNDTNMRRFYELESVYTC